VSIDGKKTPLKYDVREAHLKSFAKALQISDTFFPVGMFNFSHGFESFVQEEMVTDEGDVVALLGDILSHQIAPADCVALANGYRAAEQSDLNALLLIDEMLYAMKLTIESRECSVKTGKCLLSNILLMVPGNSILGDFNKKVSAGASPGNYAIALGLGGYLMGITCSEVMMIELYSFCVSLISAAMKLVQLDHYTAIKIINDLQPLLVDTIKENIHKAPDEMYSCAPLVDIMSIKHEQATVRMFLS
jgi:urease accessory protein